MSARPRCVWLALGLSACSWSRFDEVTSDTPIEVIERPGEIRSGFGTAMSSLTTDDGRALLLVHGATGYAQAALFDLRTGDDPITSALSDGFCSNDSGACFLAASSAPLRVVARPSGDDLRNCFALGVGRKQNTPPGVVVECEAREVLTLEVPAEFEAQIQSSIDRREPEPVALASGSDEPQTLLVGAEARGLAFYYPTTAAAPVVLDPGERAGRGFGATVAVAGAAERELLAVGAPRESSVHLFAVERGAEPAYLGCVRGEDGFGRTLTSGVIADGGAAELVVADAVEVHVFETRALLGLEPEADGTCVALSELPAGALYASVACSETGAVSGCAAAEFGASLAVGDVDGDADGELVVGAPGLSARDVTHAGALQFFDLDEPGETRAFDVKFLASARDGDRLGASVAAARVTGRHVLAAGVPGSGRTAVFYCPALLPDALGGARCD